MGKYVRKSRKSPLILIVVLVSLVVAGLAAWKIVGIVSEYREEEAASLALQQYIQLDSTQPIATTEPAGTTENTEDAEYGENTPTTEATEPAPTEAPWSYPVVDFESLLQLNTDVIGWIYIPDTKVNYPIVQGEDNRHYVSTMVNGNDNAAGSIFMDYRNRPDFSDRNTVIYGHNMRNGSMFADITKYKNPDYLAEHPTGMIMMPDGNFRFEVLAATVADLSQAYWQVEFAGDEDFHLWLTSVVADADVTAGIVPEKDDRVVVLSTCSYEFSDARYVLVCRVME